MELNDYWAKSMLNMISDRYYIQGRKTRLSSVVIILRSRLRVDSAGLARIMIGQNVVATFAYSHIITSTGPILTIPSMGSLKLWPEHTFCHEA